MNQKQVKKYAYYASTVIVIPFLTVLSISLILIGILLPIATVLEAFGIITSILNQFDINQEFVFNIGPFTIPSPFNILVALLLSGLFIFLGIKLWKLFKQYLKFIKSL